MSSYGLFGKIVTHPGQRDALVANLLRGSARMSSVPGCRLYVINTSPTEPDAVWVTEIWDSKEAHDGSLAIPWIRELITESRPLMASFGERFEVTPVGGHGLERTTAG